MAGSHGHMVRVCAALEETTGLSPQSGRALCVPTSREQAFLLLLVLASTGCGQAVGVRHSHGWCIGVFRVTLHFPDGTWFSVF